MEYIVVHELSHLIARSHNSRTIAVMDRHRPDWTARRDELNGAPLAAEDWSEPMTTSNRFD
ncbi:M48 family metallopeptidase [Corynebacterium glutamicum]|uniref:M48 metallopeptidase family protein n=1 Tax=Corynebacterium glutamicum TaxID=1718 RepID=UPI003B5A9756